MPTVRIIVFSFVFSSVYGNDRRSAPPHAPRNKLLLIGYRKMTAVGIYAPFTSSRELRWNSWTKLILRRQPRGTDKSLPPKHRLSKASASRCRKTAVVGELQAWIDGVATSPDADYRKSQPSKRRLSKSLATGCRKMTIFGVWAAADFDSRRLGIGESLRWVTASPAGRLRTRPLASVAFQRANAKRHRFRASSIREEGLL